MDWAPHPYEPNVDQNFSRGPQLNAVAISWSAITLVVITLRAISRLWSRIAFGLDDILILAAAITSWAFSGLIIAEVQHNFYGQHIIHVDLFHASQFLKGFYALAAIYPWALSLSKLSLLALYWRIFEVTNAKWPLLILSGFQIAWLIAAFVAACIGCQPFHETFNPTWRGHCVNNDAAFIANEAITMFLDLCVILVPVYFISHIQQSYYWKINMSVTFLLGLSATVVSALRLWRLVNAYSKPRIDNTYYESDMGFWGAIEINLWILVASIPAMRSLVRKLRREAHTTTRPSSIMMENPRPVAERAGSRRDRAILGRYWGILNDSVDDSLDSSNWTDRPHQLAAPL